MAATPGTRTPHPTTLTLDSIRVDPAIKAQARAEALEFFQSKLSGREAARAIRKVQRLKWHKSLASATRSAQREQKPILCVQALGDIRGYT